MLDQRPFLLVAPIMNTRGNTARIVEARVIQPDTPAKHESTPVRVPSPTLSPTDPVPRAYCVCIYVCICTRARARVRVYTYIHICIHTCQSGPQGQ
jgi:hypothetical protein